MKRAKVEARRMKGQMNTDGLGCSHHVVLVLSEAQPNGARARNRLLKIIPGACLVIENRAPGTSKAFWMRACLFSSTITSTGQKSAGLSTSTKMSKPVYL